MSREEYSGQDVRKLSEGGASEACAMACSDRRSFRNPKDISLWPWRRSVPAILIYQAISRGILLLLMFLYRQLTQVILWNVGRPAYTSGDLPYLMASWQGWVLLGLGFLELVIYTVFDINAKILLSEKLLNGEKVHALTLLREAAFSLRYFRGMRGVWVILYVSLAAPLAGSVFGITLTSNFVIPDFIISVIRRNALYHILYAAGIAALAVTGFLYLFTFDFVLLGRKSIRQAMASARAMMKENWKHFLPHYLLFFVKWIALYALVAAAVYALPCGILHVLPVSEYTYHTGIVFCSILLVLVLSLCTMLADYYTQMKLTVFYHSYLGEMENYRAPSKHRHLWISVLIIVITGISFLISLLAAKNFDQYFPVRDSTQVVAHRAGGTLGNENTLLALNEAVKAGVYGAEIDVQRTKDGAYIVNHDSTFQRTCGDPRTPGEMMLEEVKQLKVRNLASPWKPSTEVATLPEMLDAAKGRIHLFVELKGDSADEQMAEDVAAMVIERGMQSEVTVISLDYELIRSLKENFPDIETGYLCYFAFGDIADLDCDELLMEEEIASDSTIAKVQAAGKKAGVWTVNTTASMMDFLSGDADFIITDEVAETAAVRRLLDRQSDEMRVLTEVMRRLA